MRQSHRAGTLGILSVITPQPPSPGAGLQSASWPGQGSLPTQTPSLQVAQASRYLLPV